MRQVIDGPALTGTADLNKLQASLAVYQREVSDTDTLPKHHLGPAAIGLYREVGSVLIIMNEWGQSTTACQRLADQVKEELADVLWYFSAMARRLGADLEKLIMDAGPPQSDSAAPTAGALKPDVVGSASDDDLSARLGQAAARLLRVSKLDEFGREALYSFGRAYRRTIEALGIALEDIAQLGAQKARHGFVLPALTELPRFDAGFPDNQRLPENFQIQFVQRTDGRCQMIWNENPIGDPLNDSAEEADGYRFHDVFHLAHVAILNWSPTFRAIAGLKRKSVPRIDDSQDGGRALAVEEGIVAWVFGRAKAAGFFEVQRTIAFSQLKIIQQFVKGFEVEQCPPRLWERAILAGCDVFRALRRNHGGVVTGDLGRRMLRYRNHARQLITH